MAEDTPGQTHSGFSRLEQIRRGMIERNEETSEEITDRLERIAELTEESINTQTAHREVDEEVARDEEFADKHYREKEFSLLEQIRDGIMGLTGREDPETAKPDQKSTMSGFGAALSRMMASPAAFLKSAAALGARFAGPLALVLGVFSFMDGIANAEEILGRVPEGIVDKMMAGGSAVISSFINTIATIGNFFLPENMQIPTLSAREVYVKAGEVWDRSVRYLTETSFPQMAGDFRDVVSDVAKATVTGLASVFNMGLGFIIGDETAAEITSGMEQMGHGLIETVHSLTSFIQTGWNKVFGDGERSFGDDLDDLQQGIDNTFRGYMQSMEAAFDWLLDTTGAGDRLEDLRSEVNARYTEMKERAVDSIVGVVEDIVGWFEDIKSSIEDRITAIRETMMESWDNLVDRVTNLWPWSKDDNESEQEPVERPSNEELWQDEMNFLNDMSETEASRLREERRIAEEAEARRRRQAEAAERLTQPGPLPISSSVNTVNNMNTVIQQVTSVSNPNRHQVAYE